MISVMLALEGPGSESVTELLRSWSEGDSDVLDQLWPLIYNDLKKIAVGMMQRERDDHTLQATALVHEAFLRLVDQGRVRWQDRRQFFAVAARMMRRILVNHARERGRLKRGEHRTRVTLIEAETANRGTPPDLVAVDEALSAFEEVDPEKARIVELRFFAGLSNHEIAALLGCSEKTVRRHWKVAQVWLYHELTKSSGHES